VKDDYYTVVNFTNIILQSSEEYASWIRDTFNWGGEIELQILAQYLQTEICVVPLQEGMPLMVYGEGMYGGM
jgi:hypothetical protein